MWSLYRLDVHDPTVPTDLLLVLVERLAYEPCSLYRAVHLLGGPEWFGWSVSSSQLADVSDRALLTARASAVNPKAHLGKKDLAPRPGISRAPHRPSSLMEDFSSFLT